MIDSCESRAYGLSPDEIHWVLTVPAIWDDAAKQFMREAAINVRLLGLYKEVPVFEKEKKPHMNRFLAHLSRRLTGKLIGYPWIRRPSVRRPSVVVRPSVRSHFQTSSPL